MTAVYTILVISGIISILLSVMLQSSLQSQRPVTDALLHKEYEDRMLHAAKYRRMRHMVPRSMRKKRDKYYLNPPTLEEFRRKAYFDLNIVLVLMSIFWFISIPVMIYRGTLTADRSR